MRLNFKLERNLSDLLQKESEEALLEKSRELRALDKKLEEERRYLENVSTV